MIGNHLQRLFPLVSTSSARSKTNRTPSTSVAHRPARLPQSQPMQRSVGTPVSDSESSSPGSPPSDDDLIFESATSTYASSQPLLTHLPDTLHNPLHSGDPTLLCVAELLSRSFIKLKERRYFTPSIPPTFEDCSEEEATVLAAHQLVQKSALPVDTFVLAALIIQQLPEAFYVEWKRSLSECVPHCAYSGRSKELVIMTAIIVAQKFLHDAIYILTTWSEMVCEYRDDIHNGNLAITERLILKHIEWRVSKIADTELMASLYTKVHDDAKSAWDRYEQFLPYPESDDYDDSPGYYN